MIPLRRKQPQRRGWPQWASLAATLVIGVVIGHALLRTPSGGESPVISRNGQVLANGALSQALSDQLANTQAADAPVRIGVTFKSKAGAFCRTFTLHESTALAGLACRDHDDWRVQILAQSALPASAAEAAAETNSSSTGYRQANSQMPHSILQAVEDTIAGDPLDAHAEAQARDQHWSAP